MASTTTSTSDFLVDRPPAPAPTGRGLSVRRALVVAAPVLGGLGCVVGAAFDPAAGVSGEEMFRIYAESPGPLQLKSLGYQWGYALWIGTALLVAPWVRGRGVWLATLGALLGFAGMITLPGMLSIDWVDSAVGQLHGVAAVGELHDHMDATMWGLGFMMLPGILGLALALPLAAAGLWRAGVVRWWAWLATVLAFAAFMVSMATWWGAVLATGFLAVFAVGFARGTREA